MKQHWFLLHWTRNPQQLSHASLYDKGLTVWVPRIAILFIIISRVTCVQCNVLFIEQFKYWKVWYLYFFCSLLPRMTNYQTSFPLSPRIVIDALVLERLKRYTLVNDVSWRDASRWLVASICSVIIGLFVDVEGGTHLTRGFTQADRRSGDMQETKVTVVQRALGMSNLYAERWSNRAPASVAGRGRREDEEETERRTNHATERDIKETILFSWSTNENISTVQPWKIQDAMVNDTAFIQQYSLWPVFKLHQTQKIW